jgi:hypothetical protein
MDVIQFAQETGEDNQRPVYIFNPTSSDFTCTYDTNGDGNPLSYTIGSREAKKFPQVIAQHIAKKLTEQIVGKLPGVITDTILTAVMDSITSYERLD